jgi:two-component system chemotaxis sensor kinase CheA
MRHLFQIIHIAPDLLEDFLGQTSEDMQKINQLLKAGKAETKDLLNLIFQLLHGIKGNALLLGLESLGKDIHKIEDSIKQLQKSRAQWDDLLDLTLNLGDLQKTLGEIEDLVKRIKQFSGGQGSLNRETNRNPQNSTEAAEVTQNKENQGSSMGISTTSSLISAWKNLLLRESQSQQKKAQLVYEQLDLTIFSPKEKSVIQEISAQMIRNSLAHGIEDSQIRQNLGKEENGTIELSSRMNNNRKIFQYRDDGAGLDAEKIRQQARSLNPPVEKLETLTQGELIHLIFRRGFSTNSQGDISSGRGMGMAVIRDKVRQAGGKLRLSSKKGQYTCFIVEF